MAAMSVGADACMRTTWALPWRTSKFILSAAASTMLAAAVCSRAANPGGVHRLVRQLVMRTSSCSL